MSSNRHPPGRSLVSRIGRWLGGFTLAVLLITTLALTAAFSFEQSTLQPLAERLVESTTGRRLSIDGELDAQAGRIVTLKAGGISLANADWGEPQPMLYVEHLAISIDLWRVLTGTPAAEHLVIDGAQLLVEQSPEGRSNWDMSQQPATSEATAPTQKAQSSPPVLPLVRSQLSDIDVTVIDAALSAPLTLHFASITHRADQGDALQASIAGQVKDRPFKLETRIHPVSQLLAAGAVQVELEAASRSVNFDLEGEVDNLAAPTQVSAHVSLAADDIAQVLATLGLPPLATGATELKASLLPAGGEHTLDLYAEIVELKLDAQARLQSLTSIDGASANLSASGPDLAAVAKLAGVDGLPAQPFDLEASVALQGTQFTLGETRFDSGNLQLEARGSMARFPGLANSNLQLRLAGRNYVELLTLLGLTDLARLRPAPFKVQANLEYSENRQQLFNAELALADVSGTVSGKLGETSGLVGTELDYQLSGRNDALLQQWLGRPTLIEGGYSLQGKVTRSASGYDIHPTAVAIGANRLQASGKLGNQPLLGDTELSLRFEGPDLVKIAQVAGYNGFLPNGDADIATSVAVQDHRLRVESLEARLGSNRLQATGEVNLKDALTDSRVKLTLAGEDIADVVPPAYHNFIDTGQSFDVNGELATAAQKLVVNKLQARLGENALQATGSLSALQPLTDTALSLDLDGPDLAAFIPANLVAYDFPSEPFALSGAIAVAANGITLDGVKATIGEDHLGASGTLPLDTPTDGLKLAISARGPNLAASLPFDQKHLDFTELSYDLAAKLQLENGRLSIQQLEFATPKGHLSGQLSLSLDDPRASGRFDLRAKGDNLDEFAPTTPEYHPAAVPFEFDARGRWDAKTLDIDEGKLRLGSANIEANGNVSLPPDAIASQLVLSAHGDSLADLGQVKGLVFPQESFSVDATFQGDANGLKIPKLAARLGASDVNGSVQVSFAEIPDIVLKLESELLDIAALLPPVEEADKTETAPEPAANDGRVIPQVKVPAEQLHTVNLEANIDLGELRLPLNDLHDVEIDATLQDGHLKVRNLQATATEGQISARFEAIADGDSIATRGELEGKDMVLGKEDSEDAAISLPKQDLHLGFDTRGATLRDLAANLDGFAQLTGGAGRLKNSLALGLFGSFFTELLSAINPFVTKEPYTTISCYAAYAEIVDGVAEIKPGAVLQTDKLDMFAHGQIDLNTEQLALRFDTSARSGIGISVADFVNPFVGVSGTMARPGLGVDPENAMFEGGFAYATGGLSIVVKSLFNRWFGAKDPCAVLQQQAQEYQQEKQAAEAEAAQEKAAQQDAAGANE